MQILKRKIDLKDQEKTEIKRFGVNSLGTFSIILGDLRSEEEIIINLREDEIKKLESFLDRID